MVEWRIPLSRPSIVDADRRAVLEVLSGTTLSLGPWARRLESRFSNWLSADTALVSSGSAGLFLALRALGVGGGAILTPSYGFIASAHAIRLAGAEPRFVDVERETGCVSVATLEAAWDSSVSAILPVHIFGTPAPIEEICEWAASRGVPVIEDACEALGASQRGRPLGTIANAGVFAFYPNKQMTMGEGGLVVSNDREVVETVRSQRNQGRQGAGFQFSGEGFNFRITELQAALGCSQLDRLEELLERRADRASRYRRHFSPIERVSVLSDPAPADRRSWFTFPIFLEDDLVRADLAGELASHGIETSCYFPPIHHFPPYDEPRFRPVELPVTEDLGRRGLALPLYPDLPIEALDEIGDRVQKFFRDR